MPISISYFKALSDLPNLPILQGDPSKLHQLDAKMYAAGIRPGQSWAHTSTANRTIILGYSSIGFIVATLIERTDLRTSWVTPCATPKNEKEIILDSIEKASPKSQSAPARILSSILPISMTDKFGNVLPGRGIDALLSTLNIFSVYYHDAALDRAQYVINCEGFHYTIYDKPVAIGGACTKQCPPERPEANLKALIRLVDMILKNVYQAPSIALAHPIISSIEGMRASIMAPRVPVYGSAIQRIVLESNQTGLPRFESEIITKQNQVVLEHNTSNAISKTLLRSGEVFKLFGLDKNNNPSSAGFIRIYKKRCGLYHFEISESNTFMGKMDLNLLDKLSKHTHLSMQYRLEDTQVPCAIKINPLIRRCSICNSDLPVLAFTETLPAITAKKKILPTIETLPRETTREYTPACGDLVLYHNKPAMITNKNTEGYKLLLQNGRVKRLKQDKKLTCYIKPGEEHKSFLDNSGLLKMKFPINKWHNVLFPGSRMKVKETNTTELAGREVTIAGFPIRYRRDGLGWEVEILESSRMLDIYKDLTISDSYILVPGTTIKGQDVIYRVEDIIGDTITLSSNGKTEAVSEVGLRILLARGDLKINRQFSIESLLVL